MFIMSMGRRRGVGSCLWGSDSVGRVVEMGMGMGMRRIGMQIWMRIWTKGGGKTMSGSGMALSGGSTLWTMYSQIPIGRHPDSCL